MRRAHCSVIELFAGTLTVAVLTGCGEHAANPASPSPANTVTSNAAILPQPVAPATLAQAGHLTANLTGTWNMSGIVQLTVPEWVAQFVLGIQPEGAVTHIRCRSSGTMDLTQVGATFSGTQDRAPNVCETRGGQVYEEPKGTVIVLEGRIRGRSVEFVLADGPLTCPQHGVIADVGADGMATRLEGTARCIVPGHPQSEAPPPFDLEPPPAGTSKTLNWEGTR